MSVIDDHWVKIPRNILKKHGDIDLPGIGTAKVVVMYLQIFKIMMLSKVPTGELVTVPLAEVV